MNPVILLAAGVGRRFGGDTHKCLVPLQFGEGSLQRILRQLIQLDHADHVCVVTGHQGDAVSQAARIVMPEVHCVPNPGFATGTLLASVATGLMTLRHRTDVAGAWVLFTDTVYRLPALASLFDAAGDEVLVASVPADGVHDAPIGVQVASDGSCRLEAIGPGLSPCDGVMAPAVFWPRASWDEVVAATAGGARAQWQVVASHCARGVVRVVPLAAGDMDDLDTPAQLAGRRAELVTDAAVGYFRNNISKDERNVEEPDRIDGDRFTKMCERADEAQLEHDALTWVGALDGEPLVPRTIAVHGRRLTLEFVRGIRLYDLLRLLRTLGAGNPHQAEAAEAAAQILMERSLDRLIRVQRALLAWPGAVHRPAYPLDLQVGALLDTILGLLQLPAFTHRGRQELADLIDIWQRHDAVVPFRDATPKNILVAIPELAPGQGVTEEARISALATWLNDEGAATRVPILDYDFTSVRHRTAPEDDLLSLLCHQGSIAHARALLAVRCPEAPDWADAVSRLASSVAPSFGYDPERTARALLVRYLRFGGRKLIYRIVNPAAFAVRFRYDSPQYYFDVLPSALRSLDPAFPERYPELLARLQALADAIRLLPRWSPNEAQDDFYRGHLGRNVRYWQESPAEHSTYAPSGGFAVDVP